MKFDVLLDKYKIQTIQKILFESFQIKLDEVIISKEFNDVLDKVNLNVNPDKEIPNIKKIDLGSSEYTLKIKNKWNKEQEIKLTKVLRVLFPDINDKKIGDLGERFKTVIRDLKGYKDFSYKIFQNVYDNYNVSISCMVDNETCEVSDKIKFYDLLGDLVSIIILYKNEKPIGRALLWNGKKIDGTNGNNFLDRTYPSDSEEVRSELHNIARKNNWAYRSYHKYDKNKQISSPPDYEPSEIILSFEFPIQNIKESKLPYIDTFVYGILQQNSIMIFTNSKEEYDRGKEEGNEVFKFDDERGTDIYIDREYIYGQKILQKIKENDLKGAYELLNQQEVEDFRFTTQREDFFKEAIKNKNIDMINMLYNEFKGIVDDDFKIGILNLILDLNDKSFLKWYFFNVLSETRVLKYVKLKGMKSILDKLNKYGDIENLDYE